MIRWVTDIIKKVLINILTLVGIALIIYVLYAWIT